jgi:hypothetical protein
MAASSVIREAWYRPDLRELELLLWSGRRYLYTHVPADIAERFAGAESKGRFYNRAIRNCFPCHELASPRRAG